MWWLPPDLSSDGNEVVYLSDIPITADGIDLRSSPLLDLPDVRVGTKATFTNMKGRMTKTALGITLSISGTLNLYLPQNSQTVTFTAQVDTAGRFQGTLEKLTLKISAMQIEVENIGFTSRGLSAAKGTLSMPGKLGGVSAIVSNISINATGLSIGGGGVGIPLPDFVMASGVFSVTNSTLTFEVSADRTYKATIDGTIGIAIKSLTTQATASISVDSRGNVSGAIQSFTLQVAGLGLSIEEAQITNNGFFAGKAAFEVPASWGGLTAEVYNVSVTGSGISIGGGKFILPDIRVGKVTLAGLEGSFIQAPGGYEIGAGGKFVIPGLGGGANCGIGVSVTLFVDASGQLVARIEPAEESLADTPDLREIAAAGDMHPANFSPDDVNEIQGLALRNVTVGMYGCSIPIGNTGLFLTRVSGSLTLNQGTTRIDLGVTIAAGPQVLGVRAFTGDVDLGLQFNPFQMDMAGAISIFSIFKMAEMQATVRQGLFSATLRVVQIWPPFEGEASITIWTNSGFHLVGRATLTLGFDKGALGKTCIPVVEWPCTELPPFDMRLAEVGADFGEFVNDEGTVWGLKAWVTIGVLAVDWTFTVGVYFDASGELTVGNVDEYQTVTPPTVFRARALWDAVQHGNRLTGSLSAEERDILRTYAFGQNEIYVAVPVAEPTDLLIMLSRVTDRPAISLIRPDGLEITPDNAPANVGFQEDIVTGKDSSGNERTATQVMVGVKEAQPGIWQVKLSGPLGEADQYVLQVNGIDPEPVLRDVSAISTGPTSARFGWSLVSNDITTTLNIYATTGPITATQVVTDSNGVPQEVTVPVFSGAPIATSVPTPLNGTPASVDVDLSTLESGTYYIWFDADDGRNPPIRMYAPDTISVTQAWQSTWTADLRATSAYRQVTLAWDRSPNPDTDSYRLRVNALPGQMAARGLRVTRAALNTPPEIDVGNVLSTTLYNLAPDQPYYISVLAVDEDTGRVSQSEEIAALPQGAAFDLHADTTDITLNGGDQATLTVNVTTGLNPYPSTVSLALGAHPDGVLLEPETAVVTPTVAGVPVRVTVYTTRGVPDGTYTVNLVAKGGGVERTLPVQVTVQEPDFGLAATPATVTLEKGSTTRVTISAQGQYGEAGPVRLSLDRATFPAWLDYSLTSSDVVIGGDVTLILTDTQRVVGGEYTLSLSGRIGDRTRRIDIPLTLAKPHVALSAAAARKVGLYSETITYTLNLTGGPAGTPVELSLPTPIPGSTWGFVARAGDTPVPTLAAQVPGQVFLVVEVTSDIAQGTYRLAVRGAGDGWETTLPLELAVQPEATAADISIGHAAFPDMVAGTRSPYTLTISNYGPLTATHVVVTDTLTGDDVTLIGATPSQGNCTVDQNALTCDLGDMLRDATATVVVEVDVAAAALAGAALSSVARVTASEPDATGMNNRDRASASTRTQSNLAVTVADVPAVVAAGTGLEYRLVVSNDGPSDARSVTLQDVLPQEVTFVSAESGQGTCTANNGIVVCDLGTLPAGESTTVTLAVAVSNTAAGTLVNMAEVSTAEADPVPEDNTARSETAVTWQADLSLEGSATPNPAIAGRSLTYSFLVTNHGPSDVTDAQLTDVLPANATFVSGTPVGCAVVNGTVTCALGSIASGESRLATLTVLLSPEYTGALDNSAEVHSAVADPQQGNNVATASTTVAALADLSLHMADAADPVKAGEALVYTLIVSNDGPSNATDVTLQDTLPGRTRFISASSSQGECSESEGTVTCHLGGMRPQESVSVQITLDTQLLIRGGRVRNFATVTSATPDSNPANNEDAAVTTVSSTEVSRFYLPVMMQSHTR